MALFIAARKWWSFRRFTRHRDLRIRPLSGVGLITGFNGTEVDQGVFLFGLSVEASRASLLPAKAHFHVVVRATRDFGVDPGPPKHDIEHPLHRHALSIASSARDERTIALVP